jgi:choline kinase/mannose-6-phosphate isomerase-like protein (cupin superfamily)/thiamine kinase-like enzyme
MKTIHKPWGREEWLELNNSYCYKRIYINAGYKTSYQYHNFKRETNFIISGQAEIWLENDEGVVEKKIMGPGEYFNVIPPKKHRVIALTDIILQEVSTPEVDDVIRIEDDTNRVDGKIDGEHQTPAVLILAAGYGTRLKNLTNNINKVLLPINNKAIISHIIDMFPINYDVVIALGYEGESIKEYCKITHQNRNFIFVDVDVFDSEHSGPGYSALMCSEHLQRPFYFITGDCVIDSPLPYLDGNWLGCYPTSYPEKYSTISTDEFDNINSFLNKDVEGHDNAFIGLGSILDYQIFWNELSKNILNGEVVSAFVNPKNYPTFKVKKLKWFDTGNLDDLQKTREYFKDKPLSLQKNTNEITYFDNDKFLKFVPDITILNNRSKRAKLLDSLIPPNFGSTSKFIHYDWVKGNTLYEIDNLDVFTNFLKLLEYNLKSKVAGNDNDIQEFYVTKTKKRIDSFVQKNGINYLELEHEVNDIKRPSLNSLLHSKPTFELSNDFYVLFHGDLQFDNIIYNSDEGRYYYIDWRDSFGESVDSGDIYYDLSKLYGGILIPYNIMKNNDNLNYTEGSYSIKYDYPISENLLRFKLIYEKWLISNGYDLQKIKLITGLIFLNMSPLHDEKFGKMLWFKGIEMIDDYDK